jgi:hypothetical protein
MRRKTLEPEKPERRKPASQFRDTRHGVIPRHEDLERRRGLLRRERGQAPLERRAPIDDRDYH